MLNFSTGLTAIRASQVALDTVAQNIANANTPGYHRQVVLFKDNPPLQREHLLIGTGVEVTDIRRMRHGITEAAFTQNIAELARANGQIDIARQIENLLIPTQGSVFERIQNFFEDLAQLTTRPDDAALRSLVLQGAVSLTTELHALESKLVELVNQIDAAIHRAVDMINDLSVEIADLNRQIQLAEARDLTANDIRDRRDQLVNELAQLVDVHIEEQGPGQSVVIVGGGAALIGRNPLQLRVANDDAGNPTIIHEGIDEPLQLGGGQLAGLLAARNELLPGLTESLSNFATGLITTVDAAHAAGVGATGPFELLLGARGVSDTSVPLSEATSFDLQSGELFINVTDQATGDVTLHRITFDPATESLQDLAATISSVANIQAVVDTQNGSLQIIAQPGYAFDFTGSLPTQPDTAGITGTTVPQFHGRYDGAANQEMFFEVVGSGTVGVDAGLTLEVRNAAGDLIGVHAIGTDYEPGSLLNLGDGISVSLSSGTVNAGDTFDTTAVAQSDTSGILTALGLNTFFVGAGMSDIAVNPALLDNPDLLATSKSGELGDNLNLQALLATRDASLGVLGNQTIEAHFAGLLGDVGQQIQDLTLVAGNLELLGQHLEAERAAISGVDTNEELVHLVEYQRWFQAASRYIATMDETLDELFRILG